MSRKVCNKPCCWVQPSMRDKSECRRFNTYAELKKNIRSLIEENQGETNCLTVSRTRRGEWGEWYEKWSIINGKPQIWEQGWM